MPHVEKIIINKEDVNISIKNILLFAGYRVSSPEVNYATRANEIKARMEAAFTPRACYIKAAIDNRGEDFVDVLGIHLVSKPLAGLLSPCGEVYLFAATTGANVDRFLTKAKHSSPVDNMLADAAGSAAIEATCDFVDSYLADKEGKKLCQRFSPGYSELSIDCQPSFLHLLDSERAIGLTITDSMMMAPVKSVTAIVGIPKIAGTEKSLY